MIDLLKDPFLTSFGQMTGKLTHLHLDKNFIQCKQYKIFRVGIP